MKQTAVEWLFKNIWTNPPENLLEILDKAKEMEKQQQGYSEEEVLDILREHTAEIFKGSRLTLTEWFEQFKNK